MEKTLTTLVAAETEARRIIEEAERQVQELREQAEKEARQIIEEAKRQEEVEVQQVLEESENQAQSARKKILDQAERQAEHWEELFQKNRQRALDFIIETATSFLK